MPFENLQLFVLDNLLSGFSQMLASHEDKAAGNKVGLVYNAKVVAVVLSKANLFV